ncbi:MAG: DUF1995 family protein [Sporolactobacillus sp.]|jgi:hypothetical protein|nr:DUF1995 family protein [Sporolactobacillus sp.]
MTFTFYLEHDGRKTVTDPYDVPVDEIRADGIAGALKRFADKHKLKQLSFDALEGGDYRAFYERKRFFASSWELVYYITAKERDEREPHRRPD